MCVLPPNPQKPHKVILISFKLVPLLLQHFYRTIKISEDERRSRRANSLFKRVVWNVSVLLTFPAMASIASPEMGGNRIRLACNPLV